jgi:hypothetical protein
LVRGANLNRSSLRFSKTHPEINFNDDVSVYSYDYNVVANFKVNGDINGVFALYDLSGKKIKELQFSNQYLLTIPVGTMRGIYLVDLKYNGKHVRGKVYLGN